MGKWLEISFLTGSFRSWKPANDRIFQALTLLKRHICKINKRNSKYQY